MVYKGGVYMRHTSVCVWVCMDVKLQYVCLWYQGVSVQEKTYGVRKQQKRERAEEMKSSEYV